jgi:hypothetical protein
MNLWINVLMYWNDLLKLVLHLHVKLTNDLKAFILKKCKNEIWISYKAVPACLQFIKKIPKRCNNVSKFCYSIFIWSSTYFGWHTVHHQELKTALAAPGCSYVEGCWTCSWWTLSGTLCLTMSTSYTSNNLPCLNNQRLPVQF